MTFDLGITQKSDGELELFGDMWGGSISKTLGDGLTTLKKEYAYKVIEQKFAYEGASVFREINQDGTQNVKVEML